MIGAWFPSRRVSFLRRRRLIARFESSDFFLELVDSAAQGAEGMPGGVVLGGRGEPRFFIQVFQAAQLLAGNFQLALALNARGNTSIMPLGTSPRSLDGPVFDTQARHLAEVTQIPRQQRGIRCKRDTRDA